MKIPMDLKFDILKRANVVGVGMGKEGIIVYVRQKKPLAKLYPADVVGKSYDGVPTDVIESGEIRALDPYYWIHTGPYSTTLINVKQDVNVGRVRPAPAGVSVGHVDITAGTIGYNVLKDGKRYILSNNHVLAASNSGVVGDPILQPGPHDEGQNPADQIATLYKFVLLKWINQFPPDVPCGTAQGVANALNWVARLFGRKSQLFPSRPYEEEPPPPWDPLMNKVDCALAEPLNQEYVAPGFISLPGVVDGTQLGELDMPVQKEGRTSGVTKATIATLDLTTQVNYGEKYAFFSEQISTTRLLEAGDSGSLVISLDGPPYKAIGLGFAGSTALSIINPIGFVQEALGGFSFD